MIALMLIAGFVFGYAVLGHMVVGFLVQHRTNRLRQDYGLAKNRVKLWV